MGTSVYTSTTFVTSLRILTCQSTPIISCTARCRLLIHLPRPLRLPGTKWWNFHGCSSIIKKKEHVGRMRHKCVALQVRETIKVFLRA